MTASVLTGTTGHVDIKLANSDQLYVFNDALVTSDLGLPSTSAISTLAGGDNITLAIDGTVIGFGGDTILLDAISVDTNGYHDVTIGETGVVRNMSLTTGTSALFVDGGGNLVVNSGEVTSSYNGIMLGGGSELENFGLIQGDNYAVNIGLTENTGDTSILNDGTITGEVGIYISQTGSTQIINSGSLIGDSDAIFVGGVDTTLNVTNTGDIFGSVTLGENDDFFFGQQGHVYGLIDMGDGNDIIRSGLADDRVAGGDGADSMWGGAGLDILDYSGSSDSVVVSLNRGRGWTGDAAGDIFWEFEEIIGSEFNDQLFGDANANRIVGGDGDDYITGQEGDDFLFGGAGSDTIFGRHDDDYIDGGDGNDILEGGGGSDTFSFDSWDNSTPERDIVQDFVKGDDDIDLTGLMTTLSSGHGTFLGTSGFTGTAGEFRYTRNFSSNQTNVQVDMDGDMSADLVIVLKNTVAALDVTDFAF